MHMNALVAQSGGPSPVINASLQGVIEGCRAYPERTKTLYAAWHGIEGVLNEELIDLYAQDQAELTLLKHTPASGAIGTCRYKLTPEQDEDFDRIIEVFRAHDIRYFFYIGGNDSMDTAHKVSDLAHAKGLDVICTGVPKTIDNDVGDPEFTLLDHTPGYGSTARYWAGIVRDTNEENRGMCPSECVSVLQAMGRKAGYIPAAARLADPQREMPLQIYMAEAHHTLESLHENVNRQLRTDGRCIVVVSEGFDVGDLGEAHDGFGHIEYGASKTCAAQIVASYLNDHGLAAHGQATWQVPGVLQRSMSAHQSPVDRDEALEVGRHAVEVAMEQGTGFMASILRAPGESYRAEYGHAPLEQIANSFRPIPQAWITEDGLDVTDDFIRYAQPLIGEGPVTVADRFARIEPRFVERRLPPYIPMRCREKTL
ncbi:MAG: diphosphate--fructose-6-phosphate 1-phosphotransferase [Kiritimatiellia bacterium]|nr:diphosphate--fructose-6-phosphate 1-phosphotransferase [Kiritimatiellia bacterium]